MTLTASYIISRKGAKINKGAGPYQRPLFFFAGNHWHCLRRHVCAARLKAPKIPPLHIVFHSARARHVLL